MRNRSIVLPSAHFVSPTYRSQKASTTRLTRVNSIAESKVSPLPISPILDLVLVGGWLNLLS